MAGNKILIQHFSIFMHNISFKKMSHRLLLLHQEIQWLLNYNTLVCQTLIAGENVKIKKLKKRLSNEFEECESTEIGPRNC